MSYVVFIGHFVRGCLNKDPTNGCETSDKTAQWITNVRLVAMAFIHELNPAPNRIKYVEKLYCLNDCEIIFETNLQNNQFQISSPSATNHLRTN